MTNSQKKGIAPELQGIMLILLSSFCFSLLNVASKILYQYGIESMIIVFFRSVCVLMLMTIPIIVLYARKQFSTFTKVNLVKGVIDFLSTPIWIVAISNMPLAEAVSITYLTPVITACLAIIFLKEKLTRVKVLVMCISFVGVMIIANPQLNNFNIYAPYALMACCLWASANILTKNLISVSQHPIIIVFFSNIVIFTLSLPHFLSDPYYPQWHELGLFMIMASCAAGGYMFLAYAYKLTAVNNLVPYDYSRMIFSSLMGYMFFEQIITLNTILGSLVVFTSSMFLVLHTRSHLK